MGYDDGVNIAARVEQLAGPGEICVSRTVHDHAKAKVAFGFAPMGEHRVKNIPEPVTVYRVITEPGPLAQALGLKRAGTRRWRFGMVAGAVVLLVAAGGAGLWLRLNDAPTVALQQAATPVTTSTSPVVAQQAPLDKYRIAVLPFAPGEKRQLKEQVTQNLEAYHLYLQGLHLFHRMTEEGLNNSIAYFERALQHDPNFAQAYAGIAMAYMQLGFISLLGPRDAFEKARVAAEKALEFDDTIVDAQLVAATVGQILDYDQARAKLAYERAAEVAPNSALAHDFYGIQYLSPMGQHQEAIAESRRAVELDPVSVLHVSNLGWVYYMAHQYGPAIEYLQKSLELEPNHTDGHRGLGETYVQKGMYDEAIASMQEYFDLTEGRTDYAVGYLGYAYGMAGQRDKALQLLETLQDRAKRQQVAPYAFAPLYMGLGDYDKAIEALWQDYEQRATPFLLWLNVFPVLDPLHSDPRFTELVRRIGVEPE